MTNAVTLIDCVIRYKLDGEETEIVLGVMPKGYDPQQDIDLEELPFTQFVHYWLDGEEAARFGVGFEIDEWEVIEERDHHEACIA